MAGLRGGYLRYRRSVGHSMCLFGFCGIDEKSWAWEIGLILVIF